MASIPRPSSDRATERLFVIPVLHFRSLSPTASSPDPTPPAALPCPCPLGRSIGRSVVLSLPILLLDFSAVHPLIGETARRPRSQSHFSYCFIIRVVNGGDDRHFVRGTREGEREEADGQSFINTYISSHHATPEFKSAQESGE